MNAYYAVVEVAMGWILLVEEDGKLVGVELPVPTSEAALRAAPPNAVESGTRFEELAQKLRQYFNGKRVDFSDTPIRFDGVGEFERKTLIETLKVPYGEVITYGELATRAGSPRAARAIGNAMRKNPVPIVVPCHRVIHGDGSIGGYGGGTEMKRKLLAMEGIVL